MTNTTKSSTGGSIVFTETGLIHYAKAPDNEVSIITEPKFDFSAFLTAVNLSDTIPGRIIRFK